VLRGKAPELLRNYWRWTCVIRGTQLQSRPPPAGGLPGNKTIRRDIQNWTGTSSVMEIYAGDKVVRRFWSLVSAALGTDDKLPRVPLAMAYWTGT
jgi:hypothetical protein